MQIFLFHFLKNIYYDAYDAHAMPLRIYAIDSSLTLKSIATTFMHEGQQYSKTSSRKKIAFRDFFRFFKDSSFKSVLKIRKNVVKKSRKSHPLKKRAERA